MTVITPTGIPAPAPANPSRRMQQAFSSWPVAVVLCVLIGLWAAASALELAPRDALPTPLEVWRRGVDVWRHPYGTTTLAHHALISSERVLIGFGLATVLGLLAGIATAMVPAVRYLSEPILSFFRPVPAFAFITVLIVWFGIGELPKVLLVFIGVFAPMTVYTTVAMSAMPPDLADAARTLGASERQVLLHVRLMAAIPDVLAGMRVLLGLAWTGVMGAELIAADSGLGWMIWHGMRFLDTPVIFVGVLSIATIGALMDAVLALSWRLVAGWAPRLRGA